MTYIQSPNRVLTPHNSSLSIQAFLADTTFLTTPNRYGEFVFSFVPLTNADHFRLTESIEGAIAKTEERNWENQHEQIQPYADCLDRKKNFFASQLFLPKFNVPDPDLAAMQYSEVSLKLDFRDDPQGRIYLNCQYCDFFSPSNGIENDTVVIPADPDDLMW